MTDFKNNLQILDDNLLFVNHDVVVYGIVHLLEEFAFRTVLGHHHHIYFPRTT